MGNTDERESMSESMSDERAGSTDEVETHGLTGGPTENLTERASDEADDVEAHGLIGSPTDAPTD